MLTDTRSNTLTIAERLLKVKSLIATSRKASLYQTNESDSDSFDVSETLELAEQMVGECAEEIEQRLNKKEGK